MPASSGSGRLRSGSDHGPGPVVPNSGLRLQRRGPALERARWEWRNAGGAGGRCWDSDWRQASPLRGHAARAPPSSAPVEPLPPPAAALAAPPSRPSSGPASGELRPGVRVRLTDIQSKPELNGLEGTLVAFHEEKGRWQVRLDGDRECKLFKGANLVWVATGPSEAQKLDAFRANMKWRFGDLEPPGSEPEEAMAAAFRGIYEDAPQWLQGGEARSGLGSSEASTRPLRKFLEAFLQGSCVRSVVDVGCGHWPSGYQRFLDWGGVSYVGADVVPFVLRENRAYLDRPSRLAACGLKSASFLEADARAPGLPPADLLLVKDVLMHWPNSAIAGFLRNHVATAEPRYRFVMVVQNKCPAQGIRDMVDIEPGQLLAFDLRDSPFEAPFREVFAWDSDEAKGVYLWEPPG